MEMGNCANNTIQPEQNIILQEEWKINDNSEPFGMPSPSSPSISPSLSPSSLWQQFIQLKTERIYDNHDNKLTLPTLSTLIFDPSLSSNHSSSFYSTVWYALLRCTQVDLQQYQQYCTQQAYEQDQQIYRDILRTWTTHSPFHRSAVQQFLSRVLHAYTLHSPTIGYTQGMNCIVAALYKYMIQGYDEVGVFDIFCILLNHPSYSLCSLYRDDLSWYLQLSEYFTMGLKTSCPTLCAHLEKLNIPVHPFPVLTQWLFTLFTHHVSIESCHIIWHAAIVCAAYCEIRERMKIEYTNEQIHDHTWYLSTPWPFEATSRPSYFLQFLIAFASQLLLHTQHRLMKLNSMEEILHLLQHCVPPAYISSYLSRYRAFTKLCHQRQMNRNQHPNKVDERLREERILDRGQEKQMAHMQVKWFRLIIKEIVVKFE